MRTLSMLDVKRNEQEEFLSLLPMNGLLVVGLIRPGLCRIALRAVDIHPELDELITKCETYENTEPRPPRANIAPRRDLHRLVFLEVVPAEEGRVTHPFDVVRRLHGRRRQSCSDLYLVLYRRLREKSHRHR